MDLHELSSFSIRAASGCNAFTPLIKSVWTTAVLYHQTNYLNRSSSRAEVGLLIIIILIIIIISPKPPRRPAMLSRYLSPSSVLIVSIAVNLAQTPVSTSASMPLCALGFPLAISVSANTPQYCAAQRTQTRENSVSDQRATTCTNEGIYTLWIAFGFGCAKLVLFVMVVMVPAATATATATPAARTFVASESRSRRINRCGRTSLVPIELCWRS